MLKKKPPKYLIICPRQRKYDQTNQHLTINKYEIAQISNTGREKSIQFPVIHIDEHLTWKHHIQHINNKISRSLFVINKIENFLPKSTLQTLYFSLIYSQILYGITARDPAIHNNFNSSTFKLPKKSYSNNK